MAKQDWWSKSSAADDGALSTESVDSDWLDDFEFDDETDDGDRVSGLWGRYGGGASRSADETVRIVTAQRLVQGFVDTFATGDKPYVVVFDEAAVTAGTDFKGRKVVVSHKPLFDPTVTADEANTVLTAMAVHESSHVRYGRKTAAAVEHHADPRANRLSNILDDVRIERRFVEDYPGYASVFGPALDYVAKTTTGGKPINPDALGGPLDVVVAAVRYADHVAWTPETIAERDWWTEWADRGAAKGTVAHHVAAIEEGLAHLDALPPKPKGEKPGEGPEGPEGPTTDGPTGEGPTTDGPGGTPAPATGSGQPTDEQPTAPASGQTSATGGFPVCFADEIEKTAETNGSTTDLEDHDAQDLAERAKALTDDLGDGTRGEVYWAPGGISPRRSAVADARGAAAAIRSAFARSRTGHYDVARGLSTGRLDNGSLDRLAGNDYRVFSRREAQSEGRYRVWLMVDCSASMSGWSIDNATSVAAALAAATRKLPNVSLDIWGWTTPFRLGWGSAAAAFGAVRVYAEGGPIAQVGYLPNLSMGGTPDAATLRWAGRAIRRACAPGETPVILFASDGTGDLQGAVGAAVVKGIRRSGVEVLSVAFGSLDEKMQAEVFGDHGYVGWKGSIVRTAPALGRIIGRLAAGKGPR